MPQLLLTPVSVGYLADLLLLIFVASFLAKAARRPDATPATKHLYHCLLWLSGFVAIYCYGESTLRDASVCSLATVNFIVSTACFFVLRFAYAFPGASPAFRLESRIATAASGGLVLMEAGILIYRFHALLGENRVLWRPSWAEYPLAVELFWLVGVLARKTINLADASDTRSVFDRLFRPVNPRARTSLGMAVVWILAAAIALLRVTMSIRLSCQTRIAGDALQYHAIA